MRVVFAALLVAFAVGLAACQDSSPYDTGCAFNDTDIMHCPVGGMGGGGNGGSP